MLFRLKSKKYKLTKKTGFHSTVNGSCNETQLMSFSHKVSYAKLLTVSGKRDG